MAERKGFEPLWLAPNGFQDRLVMTASIPLRMGTELLYHKENKKSTPHFAKIQKFLIL